MVSRKPRCHSESERGLLNSIAREKIRSRNSTKFPSNSALDPSISSKGKIPSNNSRFSGRSAQPSNILSRPCRQLFSAKAGKPSRARCCASIPQRIAQSSIQTRIVSISAGAICKQRCTDEDSRIARTSLAVKRPGRISRMRKNVSMIPLPARTSRSAIEYGILCFGFSGTPNTASMKGA